MIKTEIVTFGGKGYLRTWSDQSMMIERDGALYQEAIDPIDSGRTYTETDQPIADETGAVEADYLAALAEFGVSV